MKLESLAMWDEKALPTESGKAELGYLGYIEVHLTARRMK